MSYGITQIDPGLPPEQTLAFAVLAHAIADVKQIRMRPKGGVTSACVARENRRQAAHALRWIVTDEENVEFWCDAAGVSHMDFYGMLHNMLRRIGATNISQKHLNSLINAQKCLGKHCRMHGDEGVDDGD